MELLAGDCRKRVGDDFCEDADPFDGSDGDCGWMYGSRQSGSHGNDDALATLADLASPPQKLKPIRCGVKPPSEDRHPLDILAGTLDRLPEMGFGCFDAPLGSKIADVEQSGQLGRGISKDDDDDDDDAPLPLHLQFQARNRLSWDGLSLSSSVDSDSDSSADARKTVTGKRKRETRVKLEHFLEKLVGSMMQRQEKMHNQLIKVMEKMEGERIRREEAWRQQEIERMQRNEEAREQEMARSLSLVTFIKSVIGDEIEIPKPSVFPQPLQQILPEQCQDKKCGSEREIKFRYSSGGGGGNSSRRWPQEEVQALISTRRDVEDNSVNNKGSIWDEISAGMKERGYERSAKKCKEKWENMNKYYRRVMEGGRKQPEHSKTRSYFQKLGDFYKTNSSGEREE